MGVLPDDPDQGHRATAAVMQRIAGMPERPEAQSDQALAAIDRVVLAIEVGTAPWG